MARDLIESSGVMGQPEDLIRRSDAIRIIDELLIQRIRDGCLTIIGELRIKELKQDIENLPAVQPESIWIPCSKKLPEMHEVNPVFNLLGIKKESERVQVSVKVGESQLVLFGWLRDGKWYGPDLSGFDDYQINYEVTAWMPFPDPYEGSGDEGVGPE